MYTRPPKPLNSAYWIQLTRHNPTGSSGIHLGFHESQSPSTKAVPMTYTSSSKRSYNWFLPILVSAVLLLVLKGTGIGASHAQQPQRPLLQGIAGSTVAPALLSSIHVQVAGIPAPSQMRYVTNSSPFTVPPSKLFVVTGVGYVAAGAKEVEVQFNGTTVLWRRPELTGAQGSISIGPMTVPPGLAAPAGTVVSTPQQQGLILGYLADA
jgi:hypothetical protein